MEIHFYKLKNELRNHLLIVSAELHVEMCSESSVGPTQVCDEALECNGASTDAALDV